MNVPLSILSVEEAWRYEYKRINIYEEKVHD